MSAMHELPDGSGFFTAEIGPRETGLVNWIKYRPEGCCRAWLYFWRMYWSSLELSRQIGQPMTRWQAFRYAAMITRQLAL
jgi:hypothetical protein